MKFKLYEYTYNNKVIYVGYSKDLARRHREHITDKRSYMHYILNALESNLRFNSENEENCLRSKKLKLVIKDKFNNISSAKSAERDLIKMYSKNSKYSKYLLNKHKYSNANEYAEEMIDLIKKG